MDNYDKQKITEFEDMLWRAYPFMELNSRLYQLNDEYRRDKEELAFYKNQFQGLTHQVENQRQEIQFLKDKLSQFEAYIKSGKKIQELEKDFD